MMAMVLNASAEDGFCSEVEVIYAGAEVTDKVVKLKNTRADCGNWPQNAELVFILDNSTGNANAMLAAAFEALVSAERVTVEPQSQANGGEYGDWTVLVSLTNR